MEEVSDGKIAAKINSGSGYLTMALTASVAIGGFIASTMHEVITDNTNHRIQATVEFIDLKRRVELLELELDRLRPRS